jgi:hypothetical protein
MAVSVPSAQQMKQVLPSLGTPAWVAVIGLLAVGLLLAIAFGFKPLNLK